VGSFEVLEIVARIFFRCVAISLALLSSPALAADTFKLEDIGDDGGGDYARGGGPFGAGILLGEPTALTAKLFLASESAVQLHLGWAFGRHKERLTLILDYLFHFNSVIPPIERAGRFAPYVGIGGHLGAGDNDPVLGIRIPLGLSFVLRAAPLEIFAEVGPGIGLIPETELFVDGGIGARFYF
jgi:hypothetical protein